MADSQPVTGKAVNMLGGYSALAKVLANDLPSSLYTSMSFRIATQRMIYRRSGRGR